MPSETDFLYFPSLSAAVEELQRRRSDVAFVKHVDELLGGNIPEPFKTGEPRAVFARHIATPNLEFEEFYKQATISGLSPLALETPITKFVARNWEKYCLARLSFVDKRGVSYAKSAVSRIIDFNQYEGKPLNELVTTSGVPLVEFHHQILRAHLGGRELEVHDFSDWFLPNRGSDSWSHYLRYLQLYLVNGILFENYLLDSKEREFTESVVIPSFRIVADVFGVPPIIVRTVPMETEEEPYWCYYNDYIRELL